MLRCSGFNPHPEQTFCVMKMDVCFLNVYYLNNSIYRSKNSLSVFFILKLRYRVRAYSRETLFGVSYGFKLGLISLMILFGKIQRIIFFNLKNIRFFPELSYKLEIGGAK